MNALMPARGISRRWMAAAIVAAFAMLTACRLDVSGPPGGSSSGPANDSGGPGPDATAKGGASEPVSSDGGSEPAATVVAHPLEGSTGGDPDAAADGVAPDDGNGDGDAMVGAVANAADADDAGAADAGVASCPEWQPDSPLMADVCAILSWRGGQTPYPVHMPWWDPYSPTFSLNNGGSPDVAPQDGWVELDRNFGETGQPAPLPYIVLYSKHLGEMRVFTYLPDVSLSGDYLQATFTQTGSGPATGINAFADDKNPYFAQPDPSYSQVFIGKVPASPYSWVMAQFDARGYDPNVTQDAGAFTATSLHLELALVKEADVSLFGTEHLTGILTTGSVAVGTRQQGGSLVTDATNGYANGKKYFNDATGALTTVQDWGSKAAASPSAWWSAPVEALASLASPLTGWVPEVGAVAGFVTSLITGHHAAPQPVVSRWDLIGEEKLDGTITQHEPILTLNLPVPGTGTTSGYDETLGLFALGTTPAVTTNVNFSGETSCVSNGQSNSCSGTWDEAHQLQDLPVIVNPAAGIEIESVEYALVDDSSGPTAFVASPADASAAIASAGQWNVCWAGMGPIPCSPSQADAMSAAAARFNQVAIKVTFKPFASSLNGPDDLVVMRVYPAVVNVTASGSLYP
jgi:hypothetical protein